MSPQNDLAERLRDVISQSTLGPGARLPSERMLALQLGVSRPMLREELRRLTDLGLVQSRHGAGTFVTPVDRLDLLDVRMLVEPFAARRAAERRGTADLAPLARLVTELHDAIGDAYAFTEIERRIHAEVARLSASAPLRATLDGLDEFVRHSHRRGAPTTVRWRRRTAADLNRLRAAIDRGDGDSAEAGMREHLQRLAASIAGGDREPAVAAANGR